MGSFGGNRNRFIFVTLDEASTAEEQELLQTRDVDLLEELCGGERDVEVKGLLRSVVLEAFKFTTTV